MEDRNIFLKLLSVLIAGAFLASVIAPVVATPFSGATAKPSIAERLSGSDRSFAVHDALQGYRDSRDRTRESPGFLVPDGENSPIRSELNHSRFAHGTISPDPAFHWNVQKAEGNLDPGAWIGDFRERKKSTPGPRIVPTRVTTGQGTVRYIELEGGFFGIITESGDHLLPENLPSELQVDGLRVTYSGMTCGPAPNVRMWGTPVLLVRIDAIESEGISTTGTVTFIELEGGFFGIVTPSGEKYLPLNLLREFQVDGLIVSFTAREAKDTATISMWGIPVEIESITLAEQKALQPGGSWVLVRYTDGTALRALVPGTAISATFGSDGRITGTAGCNRYGAAFTTDGSSLSVGGIMSTEMYCSLPEGNMQQEMTYLSLLADAAAWTIQDGMLVITDASGTAILIYTMEDILEEPQNLVVYSRTGGFAGFSDQIVVHQDGSATVTRKETVASVTIPDETMRQLRFSLERANFPLLGDTYPAPREGADYFTYTVTYAGMTVVTEDTGIPAALAPVIQILNGIIEGSAPDDVIPPFTQP